MCLYLDNRTYCGPLRATLEAACEDLAKVHAEGGHSRKKAGEAGAAREIGRAKLARRDLGKLALAQKQAKLAPRRQRDEGEGPRNARERAGEEEIRAGAGSGGASGDAR